MSITIANEKLANELTARPQSGAPVVLEIRGLSTSFRTDHGPLVAVDNVSFQLASGRVLAVIGESGSGKSAMLRSILGIQASNATVSGNVLVEGRDLMELSPKARAAARGRDISMVFQDPLTALDPVYTIERQLIETLRRHQKMSRTAARARALELLELVQIPSPAARLKAYPSELSGGMRQRVVIAMAIAARPRVLLADEPTTALDVTVQAKILELFRAVQRDSNMGMVIVTHDLGVAAEIADDIAVMYAGRVVETGPAEEVLLQPSHPYTQGLIEANVRPGQSTRPNAIPGSPPSLARLPQGCAFAPRCHAATVECWHRQPEQVSVGRSHTSRCLLQLAPTVRSTVTSTGTSAVEGRHAIV